MSQPEKTGDHLNVRVERNSLGDEVLGPSVQQDNDGRNQKINGARGVLGHSDSQLINILILRARAHECLLSKRTSIVLRMVVLCADIQARKDKQETVPVCEVVLQQAYVLIRRLAGRVCATRLSMKRRR